MFYKNEIQQVIRRCFTAEYKSNWTRSDTFVDHDSEISTLIHDVFGGEILKTHKNKRWHFYNRINGEKSGSGNAGIGKLHQTLKYLKISLQILLRLQIILTGMIIQHSS